MDVGKHGGFAVIQNTELILACDFDKTQFLDTLAFLSREQEATRACVERVHAMPKQGVASTFSFGMNFGWILGVLDAFEISYQLIEPRKWKAEFNLNSDKQRSIEVAKQLFPKAELIPNGCRKPHDGIAESILLAEYARRKL